MSVCRFCPPNDPVRYEGRMIKYGVRHYAHATCGFEREGAAFLDRLTDFQCAHQVPYLAALRAGSAVADALERRARKHFVDTNQRQAARMLKEKTHG